MQFGILGPLEVWSAAGEQIPVGGPRPRALMVLLLLNAGRVVGVEQLIDGQYGEDPPAGAANAVQAQVSRLRRRLSSDVITFDGGGYRLAVDRDDVDAHRFERLAREGRALLAAGNHSRAAATLREALELWRGPALADLPHGRAEATRLEDMRLDATEDLVEAELALPEGSPVADLRRLVAQHPLRERLTGQLMRALHAAGRQAEALEEFERTRELLRSELGADPSPELAAVHLAVLRAEQPARSRRRGVAAQLTTFVGRERDLERLAELREVRLVTVLGPGGTGKTRLALESAGRGGREVCVADLSSLDGGEQVPHAVLGALGLRESGFQPAGPSDPVDRMVTALRGQDLLLVLDNCEHVVAAVADLARVLLAECPGLGILATSREPLGLTGETLVPLAPLDVPAPEAPVAEALAFPAVRLFGDRAAAVRPGFAVGPGNAATVAGICAALDGLPLAIELAAARLRQFGVEELASRLAEHGRFRLLSRGDRTAAARHRTLHAVVEWSWELLGPEEQVLARRLAVFTGGAPAAAAAAVCGLDGTLDGGRVEDLLADLVDKSFVETDGQRYRMLDTIRLFCAEQLEAAGERERLERAHARHHLELAQRADPHLRRSEQLDWLALLSAEHGNLMAALRWAAEADRETAFRLVAALAAYWWLSGRHSQAGATASALLHGDVPEGCEEEYVSCVVHAVPRPDPGHWARAGEIMRTPDRQLRHPFGAALWGMTAGPPSASEGDPAPLLGPDPWNAALGQLSLALLGVFDGRPAESERALLGALSEFRALGERWGIAQALDWLGLVSGWRGEWNRAHELWAEALDLQEQLGALDECADVLVHRAECLVRQGDLDAAVVDYRRAAELQAVTARPDAATAVSIGLAEIALIRGDAAAAADLLGQAQRCARTGDFSGDWAATRLWTALGRLAEAEGDPAEAARRHHQALAAARASPVAADLADVTEGQAGVALFAGAPERAALLLGAAVAVRGTAVTGAVHVAGTAGRARGLLGSEAFAEAYARGAAMSRVRALTLLDGESG